MGNTSSSSLIHRLQLSSQPVYETAEYELYDAHDGYKKLSLFVFKSHGDQDFINTSTWKTLRHPFILQFRESGEVKGHKCVLTELATPLCNVIDTLTTDEIICGIHDIMKSLDFLHSKCKLSHNNLTMDSVFLCKGSWKLGCLQFISSPEEETFDFIKKVVSYKSTTRRTSCLPPEDATTEVCQPIPSSTEIHRRDSFAMGCFIESLLKKKKHLASHLISPLKNIQKDNRPDMHSVINDNLFTSCQFLIFKESLSQFGSYSEDEKIKFITTIIESVRSIKEDLIASKVIPMLLTNRLVMLHPESKSRLHAHLLIPPDVSHPSIERHLISQRYFESCVVPVIVKLYSVKKINVRLILLQYLPFYLNSIPREIVNAELIPQIKIGLQDEADDIVAATLSALSLLVSSFGCTEVFGSKDRKKYFSNDIPRIGSHHSTKKVPSHFQISETIIREQNKALNGRDFSSESDGDSNRTPRGSSSFGDRDGDDEWIDWGTEGRQTTTEPSTFTQVIQNGKNKKLPNPALDVKAIETPLPDEVNDLFLEMEPSVRFTNLVKLEVQESDSVLSEDPPTQKDIVREVGKLDDVNGGWSDDEWGEAPEPVELKEKDASIEEDERVEENDVLQTPPEEVAQVERELVKEIASIPSLQSSNSEEKFNPNEGRSSQDDANAVLPPDESETNVGET